MQNTMQNTAPPEIAGAAEHSFADRMIDALQFFADGPPLIRLSDLARHLGISPSSAHRVVAPLVRRGMLERTAERRYRIGSEYIRMSSRVEQHVQTLALARPLTTRLCEELGELAVVGMVSSSRTRVVILHKAHATVPEDCRLEMFTNLDLVWGSLGRAILAWLKPLELRSALAEAGRCAVTDEEAPSLEELTAECHLIRKQGYARSCGQRAGRGYVGNSSPFFDAHGNVCGAIGVIAPAVKLSDDKELAIRQSLVSSSRTLSRLLAESKALH